MLHHTSDNWAWNQPPCLIGIPAGDFFRYSGVQHSNIPVRGFSCHAFPFDEEDVINQTILNSNTKVVRVINLLKLISHI